MPSPASAHLGVRCPPPDQLQTGDLLFPRKPAVAVAGDGQAPATPDEDARFALEGFAPDISVRQLLQHRYPELLTGGPHTLAQSWSARRLPPSKALAGHAEGVTNSQFDLNDPRVMYLVYKILSVEMKALFEDWLDMSVKEFRKSRLGKFLFKLLQAPDATEGNLFIGHMAMVIREHEGQVVTHGTAGQVYVIEANTTDFSHYRVALHPYWVDDAADSTVGELRGWANRRLAPAHGQMVWSARPAALVDGAASPAAQASRRMALAAQAKRWQGRPFGLFDDAEFGEPDRMYCAEYLYRVFQDADAHGTTPPTDLGGGNRTWGWMLKYFAATGDAELAGYLQDLIEKKRFEADKPFFVLTPAMVWSSSVLGGRWNPTGQGPYAPPV
jgi:hypothetical protein